MSNLTAFLEPERERFAETESTLSKLKDDKAQHEPIVLTKTLITRRLAEEGLDSVGMISSAKFCNHAGLIMSR